MVDFLIQILSSIFLFLLTSTFFIFNGCTGSKGINNNNVLEGVYKERKGIIKKIEKYEESEEEEEEPEPLPAPKAVRKPGQEKDESEKEDLESLYDNVSSESSMSINTKCSSPKINKKIPLKLKMEFDEWDRDLEISGDEEEKKKERMKIEEPKIIKKPVKIFLHDDLSTNYSATKLVIQQNNIYTKSGVKVQMKFNEWDSEFRID
jgi:hypothetical protein